MKVEQWHKVGKAFVVYLGSSWVLLEASDFFISKFALSELYWNFLFFILLMGLPFVFILNYFTLKSRVFYVTGGTYLAIFIGALIYRAATFDLQLSDSITPIESSKVIRQLGIERFENLTGADNLNYLASALQSSLILEIGGSGEVTVVNLKNEPVAGTNKASMVTFSRSDKLDAVLSASVLGSADSLTCHVTLYTITGELLWGNAYQGKATNLLALYKSVANGLSQFLFDHDTNTTETAEVNDEAFRYYWQGRVFLDQLTESDINQAINYFERALEIDSTYANAWSGIAMGHGFKLQMGLIWRDEFISLSKEPMQKMITLGDNNTVVQHTLGITAGWWLWDWEKSFEAFQKSISLNPNYAAVYADYSHILAVTQNMDKALAANEKALELEPFNTRYLSFYAMNLNNARQYNKAIEIMTDSTGQLVQNGLTYSTLRTTYHLLEQWDDAMEMWIKSYELQKDSTAVAILQNTYAEGSYSDALQALAEELIKRKKATNNVPAWNISTMLLRAGENQLALEWLLVAFEETSPNMPYINIDPLFDVLREEPEFQNLLKELNF